MTDVSGYVVRINALVAGGRYAEALKEAERGLSEHAGDGSLLIGAGNALHGLGRTDEALAAYRKGADALPEDAVALSNMAGIYYERGSFDDVLKVCDEALGRDPDYVNVWIHKGNVFSERNEYAKALDAYEQAERGMAGGESFESPETGDLIAFNKASALGGAGRYAEADACYAQLLEKHPDNPEYLSARAALLEQAEQPDKAAETYLKLLQFSDTPVTHICLSGCLYNMSVSNDEDKVSALLDEWLSRFPDNPVALHAFETFGHTGAGRASAEYVTELFDAFADSFDEVLEGLEYKAPALIAEAVKKSVLPEGGFENALDLGCGTGLCGKYLKECGACNRLTGADLSEKMLEKAAARKVYDRLECADIEEFLFRYTGDFDLIVSSDVFTYLGDLDRVFRGIAQALKAGGAVLFTVTENLRTQDPYVLGASGRFAHGKEYIFEKLDENGLILLASDSVELRKEMGEGVSGLLVIARKS